MHKWIAAKSALWIVKQGLNFMSTIHFSSTYVQLSKVNCKILWNISLQITFNAQSTFCHNWFVLHDPAFRDANPKRKVRNTQTKKTYAWWVSQSVFMLSKSFAKGLFAEEEVLKGEGEEKIVGRIFNHLPPRYTLRDMHKFVG